MDAPVLAARFGLHHIDDSATGIDPGARLLFRDEGEPVPYDLLSINPLAGPRPLAGADGDERCFTTRPLRRLLALRDALISRFDNHPGRAVALVIAGGGVTACSLAASVIALAGHHGGHVGITILTRSRLLTALPELAGVKFIEKLAAHGVILQEMAKITQVDGNEAVLASGDRIAFDLFVNATGAVGPALLAASGLPVDAQGRVRVDDRGLVIGHADMLAGGEASSPPPGLHPARRLPVDNLVALASAAVPRRARPGGAPPYLIDLGDGDGLAVWGRHWTMGRMALWAQRWAEAHD